MGMFDNLEVETGIEVSEDKVGGGGFAKVDHTGYYGMEIQKAYAGVSSGGAFSVTIEMKSDEGAFFTVTEYITSGTSKGCKNYYLDKEGNKQYLPGYNKIKALDSLLGNVRDYPATEKKNLMLWDYDLKQELPTEKEAITSWFGKKIGVLISKILEDKQVKGGDNKYYPSADIREIYDIQHFVDYVSGKTRNEITAGTSGFKDKWIASNPDDKVIDKRKLSKNTAIGSTSGSVASVDSTDNPFA